MVGEREMYDLFIEIFLQAMHDRVHQDVQTVGSIGSWEYQTILKDLETPELDPLPRRELLDIYNRFFRRFSFKNDAGVFCQVDDILYFTRKIKHKLELADKAKQKSTANKALNFRVGKKIIKNFEESVKFMPGPVDQSIMEHSTNVFHKISTVLPGGVATITRQTLYLLCQELGFFLSAGEIDNILCKIDKDGNGQIELEEWNDFLETTQHEVAHDKQRAKDAQDPRNDTHLIHQIMSHVSNNSDVLSPVLERMQHLFTADMPIAKQTKANKVEEARAKIRENYATVDPESLPEITLDIEEH